MNLRALKPEDIRLEMTCDVCPEQYDAFIGDRQVGYLRVRHGSFRVDCGDVTVYSAYVIGDGCFYEREREKYLQEARQAIWRHEHPELQGIPLTEHTARTIWDAAINAMIRPDLYPDFETFYTSLTAPAPESGNV